MSGVEEALSKEGFGQYAALLLEAGATSVEDLALLSDADLKDMGVEKVIHRRKLIKLGQEKATPAAGVGAGSGDDDERVRCTECGRTIGEHVTEASGGEAFRDYPAPHQARSGGGEDRTTTPREHTPPSAQSMVHYSARLPEWRSKFGLRQAVTEHAIRSKAYGSVVPDSLSIVLDLWFSTLPDAAAFHLELKAIPKNKFLYDVQDPIDVIWKPEKPPDNLTAVTEFKHVEGSPDRESSTTHLTVIQSNAAESARYHRIHKFPTHQQCHIIPARILNKNANADWALLSAYECFNRISDSWPPVRILAEKVEGAELVEGRTPVKITIHTTMRTPDEQDEQRFLMQNGFEEPSPGVFSVQILVLRPELMVKATQWREKCLDKAQGQEESVKSSWYNLVSLSDYGLGEYAGLGRRRPKSAKSDSTAEAELVEE